MSLGDKFRLRVEGEIVSGRQVGDREHWWLDWGRMRGIGHGVTDGDADCSSHSSVVPNTVSYRYRELSISKVIA